MEVVIDKDNPTTRSCLAMLPMTPAFSDYGGREKVPTPTGTTRVNELQNVELPP
ncbi:cyclophilin-like fold protein [Pseudarthrobacter sp. 1C304]|uniref:cyclophilin-like fold protein n=1 Tax=Pseudarthrobacter sp. 1C304 TaxID=3457438 RepID=UPI003FD54A9B